MKFSAGLLLVGLSTALSLGQVSPSGGGYLLRTKYVKGQVLHYMMKSTTKMEKNAMEFLAPMTIKVVNVDKGIADLYSTFGPATMAGQQIPAKNVAMKVDSRGRAVSGGSNGLSATFPDKPVKVGEKWTGDFNMANATSGGQASATYVFKGLKTSGKGKVAEIAVNVATKSSTPQAGGMVSKGAGTLLLNAADGQLISLVLNMTLTMGGGAGKKPMVLPTTVSLKRQ